MVIHPDRHRSFCFTGNAGSRALRATAFEEPSDTFMLWSLGATTAVERSNHGAIFGKNLLNKPSPQRKANIPIYINFSPRKQNLA